VGQLAYGADPSVHGVVDAAQSAINELSSSSLSAVNGQNNAAHIASKEVEDATRIARSMIAKASE